MKVGDLIELKQHCKHSGRLAIIVLTPGWSRDICYIAFMDEPLKHIICNYGNIIKLSGDK